MVAQEIGSAVASGRLVPVTGRARLVADGAGLENRYGETHRGFESHALRSISSSGASTTCTDAGDRGFVTADRQSRLNQLGLGRPRPLRDHRPRAPSSPGGFHPRATRRPRATRPAIPTAISSKSPYAPTMVDQFVRAQLPPARNCADLAHSAPSNADMRWWLAGTGEFGLEHGRRDCSHATVCLRRDSLTCHVARSCSR